MVRLNEEVYNYTSGSDQCDRWVSHQVGVRFVIVLIQSSCSSTMMSVDKKRFDCSALPKGWQREEITRKTGLSAGKVDVSYYRYI